MSATINFTCLYDGVATTSHAASAAIGLPGAGNAGEQDVMVYNPGPFTVFVRAGAADVVATAQSAPVLPNGASIYSKGDGTYLALISPEGDQAVVIYSGNGQ